MSPRGTDEELETLLRAVLPIARAAGAQVEEVRAGAVDAERKADGSPVTRADRLAHRCIVGRLRELRPDVPVVSEEGDPEEPGPGEASGLWWLVDPLDGTKEFLKDNGEYTVNIALLRGARPVLGVVYAPALGRLYYAAEGFGCRLQEDEGKPRRLQRGGPGPARSAAVSRSHLDERTERWLQEHGIDRVMRLGSSLKMCAVAEGRVDVYPRLGPTWYWDTAAGAAVARQAGCRVERPEGGPLSYDPAAGLKHDGFVVWGG